ncbi:MAG: TlpA family protein disulfide reductase [Gammaproteobacteria bacterium]|nr:TlpA family protein disulfide reductase [Gammaproteobacteria bacterium]
MSQKAIINQPAPQPEIECWVQGDEPEIRHLAGQVILIEVIQVNCPGCFVHALPEVIRLHESYATQGLKVFAIATAFEHFEHNTLNNLQGLLQHGELIGDPLLQLDKAGFLEDGKLPYAIPFSVAMDKLVKNNSGASEKEINQFILSQIPDFFDSKLDPERQQAIYQQAENYLRAKSHNALTFEMYQLQGTPSSILIDKTGSLRQVSFGAVNNLETELQQLLDE